ncbi:MAG TPA: metallophosphoesterase [Gemmatimonadaceae bacterium]|nr:metallophosphoesterase [Gemmatimonadaceae bacterium]
MNRRQFIRRSVGALGVGGAGIGLYTWRIEPHWVQFTERSLAIRDLPRDLEGRTLLFLSDLHVGPRVDEGYLMRTLDRARELRPDFVVYGGDFISYSAASDLSLLQTVMSHTPVGRIGTVGILGNHDYGPNWSHPEIAARVASVVSNAGVQILQNGVANLGGLQFVGLDDLWANRFAPKSAFAARDPSAATIVLSHNPDSVDEPGWEPYRGWILSGHTHGGQCKPPFLPPPILPVMNRRYSSGSFELTGNRSMYISRGVGHLLRVRFNVRPEVTVVTLAKG